MQAYFHVFVFILLVLVDSTRITKRHKVTNDNKIVLFVAIIFLYGGLRAPMSMIDDYTTIYTNLQSISFRDVFLHYSTREPIFLCLVKVIGMITSNEQLLFLVQACIVSVGFGFFVKRRSTDPLISFLVFLSLRDYSFCLAAMRQGIAIAVFLGIADKYLNEKKLLRFLISVIFASFFHTSALLLVLVYPCYHNYKDTKRFIYVIAGISVFFIAFSNVLSYVVRAIPFINKYDSYVQEAYYHSGIQTTLLIYTVLVIIIAFILKNLDSVSEQEDRCLSLGVSLGFCGVFYGALSRCAFYFTGYSSVLFPKSLRLFKDYRVARNLLIFLLLFQYIVFGPGQGGRDYQFFWINS